ncbi:MAG TPA: sulfur carrier protein ThiS [Acidimicrobiales bacterium]|nr:sulfur carrier protein ThiS [Acidimicrobiales bacterium]
MSGPGAITLRVNGEDRSVPAGATVASVVALLAPSPDGCAVALNGEVVQRGAWAVQGLTDGDHIEILTAAPGG